MFAKEGKLEFEEETLGLGPKEDEGEEGGSFHSPVMMRTEEWVGMVDGLQSGAAERGWREGSLGRL